MEAALKEIQVHPQVTPTFDLVFMGIVFLHPEIANNIFTIIWSEEVVDD